MTRRLAGVIAAGIVLLAGAWLVLAPYALGFQGSGAPWTDETKTDVWTGIGLGVVGLIGIVAFVAALRQHLVERGLVAARERGETAARSAQGPSPSEPGPAPAAAQPTADHSELDAVLAPLVRALTEDLERDRQPGNGTPPAPRRATHSAYGGAEEQR